MKVVQYIIIFLITIPINFVFGQSKDTKFSFDSSFDFELNTLTFFQEGLYTNQSVFYPSLALKPKSTMYWNRGNGSLVFEGFFRYDINGSSRTHTDIRELYYQNYKGNFEYSIGIKKFFWGKLETVHLVDIVNQIDFLEGIDGEEKLGQPVIELTHSGNAGSLSLLLLPYTRRIDFGNESGRPRTPELITQEQVMFESDLEQWHPTLALRWSHYIGDMDIGLHYFYGNARDPLILFNPDNSFILQHPVIHQLGLDYQLLYKNTIFKMEAMFRAGDFVVFETIYTFGLGVEHSFYNVNNKGLDIGIITEYVYDNRRELSFSSLDNDIFLGSRITLNNEAGTEIILGLFKDLTKSSSIGRLEASQRISNSLKLETQVQFFLDIYEREFIWVFRNDSNFELSLTKYF